MTKEVETEEIIEKPKKHIFIKLIIFILIIIVLVIFYGRYIGTKGLITKEYRIESDILTSNFNGFKIVHFSDLLYKSTIVSEDVDNLVESINILKPDIVVFTGDLTSNKNKITSDDINILKDKLKSIEAKIAKYAIYGDYDYNLDEYESIMEYADFKILNNSYDEIYYKESNPIYIVGLPSSQKAKIDLNKAFDFYNEENRTFTVVLTHNGNTIKYLDESTYEVDLILGGHSLGGNINIHGIKELFIDSSSYKYYDSHYRKGITNIYISSGLGTKKYDYRLFNKPSFNLYRLKAN